MESYLKENLDVIYMISVHMYMYRYNRLSIFEPDRWVAGIFETNTILILDDIYGSRYLFELE